jgi:flagellar basal body-associated protein FliL
LVEETSNHRHKVGDEVVEMLSTETFDDLIMTTGDISLESEVTR